MTADLAFELSTTTSIIVDVLMGSPTKWTYGVFRNSEGLTLLSFDRFHGFAITESVVLVPKLSVLFDKRLDGGKLIGKKLLVFGTVDFIMSSLFQRNIYMQIKRISQQIC